MLRHQELNAEFRIDILVSWRFIIFKKGNYDVIDSAHLIMQFNLQNNAVGLLLLSASFYNEKTELKEIM